MLVTPQDVTKFTPRLSPRAEQYEGTRLVFRIGPRSSSGSAFPIESGSDFGSPALLMIGERRDSISWPPEPHNAHPWILLLIPLKLFDAPAESRLVDCALDLDNLTVHMAITAATASCPDCGSDARRVHSRYTRHLADLPCFDRSVRLHVLV